jgi:hypothetical protein
MDKLLAVTDCCQCGRYAVINRLKLWYSNNVFCSLNCIKKYCRMNYKNYNKDAVMYQPEYDDYGKKSTKLYKFYIDDEASSDFYDSELDYGSSDEDCQMADNQNAINKEVSDLNLICALTRTTSDCDIYDFTNRMSKIKLKQD